jgi:CheY-like chemotaxis protein
MGKRILVADDSLTIQKAFAMVLSNQDYTIASARSVDEALASAKGSRPDLIIADVALGNASGYDLCASIKSDAALRGVSVYLLTSTQNPLDEARSRRAGADGHLIKPFDSQGLLDSVSAALAAPARVASGPVVASVQAAPLSPIDRGNTTDQVQSPEQAADDDSYGEFTIERGSAAGPPSWTGRPPTWPGSRTTPPATPSPATAPGNRPSLIPGVVPPSASPPSRPAPALPGVVPAPPAASVPRPAANRTIYGFPAVNAPPPAAPPPAFPPAAARPAAPRPSGTMPAVGARPVPPSAPAPVIPPPLAAFAPSPPPSAPVPPLPPRAPMAPTPVPPAAAVPQTPTRRSASMAAVPIPPTPGPLVAAVSSVIDQKIAAIAARGREYEAIAKLSREIIEQVVWEVVPELAEVIIKQEIDRLVASKR